MILEGEGGTRTPTAADNERELRTPSISRTTDLKLDFSSFGVSVRASISLCVAERYQRSRPVTFHASFQSNLVALRVNYFT